MTINPAILAVETTPRARVRRVVVPIVPAVPPQSYFRLTVNQPSRQLLYLSTEFDDADSWNRIGGSMTTNAFNSPVNGALTADQWTGSSTLNGFLRFPDYNPRYYTFSFYARGVTPSPSVTFNIRIYENDIFNTGQNTLALNTITVPTGSWQRFSITAYVARPTIMHVVQLGAGGTFGAGESVYLANAKLEEGAIATTWTDDNLSDLVEDVYTEFTQEPQREGQLVVFIERNSENIPVANLYVVVNIEGTLTWKRCTGVIRTLDPNTGEPFDPNVGFYSPLN